MVVAIDCDLRKLYAVDSNGVVLCNGGTDFEMPPHDTILFEIAGEIYQKHFGPQAVVNLMRWSIYNSARAGEFDRRYPGRVLVATSAKWSSGYTEEVRQKVAGATARNKHLRDAQAMIYFHRVNPGAWQPLHSYLEKL